MAGFRGVKPSRESCQQMLANLYNARRVCGERLVAGIDPHKVQPGGRCTLADSVALNAALIEVFEGLLAETTVSLTKEAA